MAGEGSILAIGHSQVGLGDRELRGDIKRIGAHVAGLAAVNQACAAKVVDGGAGGIHVDLDNFLVEAAHALLQALERAGAETGEMLGGILTELRSSVFGRLVN